ncbi:hypothetical protein [Agrobacterium tumefaciens]|uniref:hypothetical protein n=1 Tax=Agrobacterium tumefaciens TaxID=358 RepID=UPI0005594B1C|nr:hypothetical protein [Agrobacterium tumefaciens]
MYNSYGRQSTETRWQTKHWDGLKAFVKFVRDLGDPKVVLVPIYCTVNRDAGFKYSSTVDAQTGAYIETLSDSTHYAENGLKEHGEVLAQFIAGAMTDT